MKTKTMSEKVIMIVFSTVGILCIIAAIIMGINSIKIKTAYVKTDATIIGFEEGKNSDGETTCYAVIRYRANGSVYESVTNESKSSWKEGDHITVYYNPDSPFEFSTEFGTTFGTAMMALFGVVFAAVGLVPSIISAKRNGKNHRLKENGTKIEAKVIGFDYNENYSVNGRHPFIIETEYLSETGERHRFKSGNVWDPLGEEILGHTIDVYFEPDNMDKYFVDVDSLFSDGVTDTATGRIIEH